MTSLRDLFKKSKNTAKETTDKILDADIEQNLEKVKINILQKIDGRTILLGIIFVIFIFFLVVVSIINWG